MNLKKYCGKAAEVLRSSERMVQRNLEICRETPESAGKYYDPDWDIRFEQDEIKGLIRNLTDAANFFDVLAQNSDAAADLLKAHIDAKEGDV